MEKANLIHKIKAFKSTDFALRFLLCLLVGFLSFRFDESSRFDMRFKVRGYEPPSQELVLITISLSELRLFFPSGIPSLAQIEDSTELNFGIYWNKSLWTSLIPKILAQEPKAIAMAFYFNENSVTDSLSRQDWELFTDQRIKWMNSISPDQTINRNFFASTPIQGVPGSSDSGFVEIIQDADGMVRRFRTLRNQYVSLSYQLAKEQRHLNYSPTQETEIINFRGPSDRVFNSYRISEILQGQIGEQALKDKIVVIGPEVRDSQMYRTPVGPMNRQEIIAATTDHLVNNRFIKKLPIWVYFLQIFIFNILFVFIIFKFPQSIAFLFFIFINLISTSLSFWLFDYFKIWTPLFSPILTSVFAWIIFVGFLVSQNEKKIWLIRKEKETLQELELLKTNFISLISHDLKNPIAKIQAVADRMLNMDKTLWEQADIVSIKNSNSELFKYIESIIQIIKVEAKDFRIQKMSVDPNQIIESTLNELQPLAYNKNIQFIKNLEPLFSIEADPVLLHQIFLNLIENAIKYSPANAKILISSIEEGESVKISIQDEGEGISKEEQGKVFNKFYRGLNQAHKTKGTGLGLYLVKYFVELHKGQVLLTSEPGKGTCVNIFLPL